MIVGKDCTAQYAYDYLESKTGIWGADTETTGLYPHGSPALEAAGYPGADSLFAIIVTDGEKTFYFDYRELSRLSISQLAPFFANPKNTFVFTNAKFDLSMLEKEGLKVKGKVVCTMAYSRVIKSDLFALGLDATARAFLGTKKDDQVKAYIKANKLITKYGVAGKAIPIEQMHYDRVPLEIMAPYACTDAELSLQVANHCVETATAWDAVLPEQAKKRALSVLKNEARLTKTLYRMEKRGVMIDREYCTTAYNHEKTLYLKAAKEFETHSGIPFEDGRTVLVRAFTAAGEKYPLTEKGNPSFTSDVLDGMESPLAKCVLDYREHYKLAHTYFANFLFFADDKGAIHANAKQAGTVTGRMSYGEPNLQNVPKDADEDTNEFSVRGAFIPRKGRTWLSVDYSQLEYRLMLIYAKQMDVIEAVKGGADLHQAFADMVGVTRQQAKTLNFMLLYGGGAEKLSKALKLTLKEAQDIKRLYFSKLPKVEHFVCSVAETALRRGYIVNFSGRRCYVDPGFTYKAPNYLIQGSGSDAMKIALNEIDKQIIKRKLKSRMLITVHDEVDCECPPSELEEFTSLVRAAMTNAYPNDLLPLTTEAKISKKSWGELEKYA